MGAGTEFDENGLPDWEGYEEWSIGLEESMGYYDEEEYEGDEEYEDEECDLCCGTGIGQHGDPNTSRCSQCGGNGYYLRADIRQEREYARADYLYDCWKDDNL